MIILQSCLSSLSLKSYKKTQSMYKSMVVVKWSFHSSATFIYSNGSSDRDVTRVDVHKIN